MRDDEFKEFIKCIQDKGMPKHWRLHMLYHRLKHSLLFWFCVLIGGLLCLHVGYF